MPPAPQTKNSSEFTVLLFASASSYAGLETLSLPAPSTLRDVFTQLESKFPGITEKVLLSSAVTVNLEYVDFDVDELERQGNNGEGGKGEILEGGATGGQEAKTGAEGEGLDMVINKGDEVGIIPPVSSG